MIQIRTISAINRTAGTVDVVFSGKVSTNLGLLDTVDISKLAVGQMVACAFPDNSGIGFCLGRFYNDKYKPGG